MMWNLQNCTISMQLMGAICIHSLLFRRISALHFALILPFQLITLLTHSRHCVRQLFKNSSQQFWLVAGSSPTINAKFYRSCLLLFSCFYQMIRGQLAPYPDCFNTDKFGHKFYSLILHLFGFYTYAKYAFANSDSD